MQSNKDHAAYSDFFSSQRKCKPEGYHPVCVQYVALSCCLSAEQMAKSRQCKVPTTKGQRLDSGHASKLKASLPGPDSSDAIAAEIEVSQRAGHCTSTPASLSASCPCIQCTARQLECGYEALSCHHPLLEKELQLVSGRARPTPAMAASAAAHAAIAGVVPKTQTNNGRQAHLVY
jgi:hypothetical protein